MNTVVFHFVYFMFLYSLSLQITFGENVSVLKKTLQKQMPLFFIIIYLLSISPMINTRPPPLALKSLFFFCIAHFWDFELLCFENDKKKIS